MNKFINRVSMPKPHIFYKIKIIWNYDEYSIK